MTHLLASALVAFAASFPVGCGLVGDPTPTVDACESWEAANTDVDWLTARTSLAEIAEYLHDKRVPCAERILAQLSHYDRQGSQFWKFRNPGNREPALTDGYAVVANGDVVTSFYKLW